MISEKLLKIQSELKAPKGQYNSFGKYKYRSCEDILEAVKPLTQNNKCVLKISDTLKQVGDRYYIEATATLTDIEDSTSITNTAYAREEKEKKGMDGSQITGTASSYARKYALNGLFCIDDTKDADTDEFTKNISEKGAVKVSEQKKRIDEKINKLAKARNCDKAKVISSVNKACGNNQSDSAKEDILDAYLIKLVQINESKRENWKCSINAW